jgi:AraC-like DNA-binding protein
VSLDSPIDEQLFEMSHYEQLRPPLILSDSIECFWRLLVPLVIAPDEIISAENRAEILFQFHGKSQILPRNDGLPFDCASSWLMRPNAHALHVRQVGVSSSAMIGVRFVPGGWANFQQDDTTDKQSYSFMPLSDFYAPSQVRVLEEQLFHVLHTPQWAAPLISFFSQRRVEQRYFEQLVYATKQLSRQEVSISALAHAINLSERQFRRVFRHTVGLSPKEFSRVARLNRVLSSSANPLIGMSLAQIAHRHGFHDASHLVREFRELVDISPLDYFTGYYDLIDQKFREHDRFLQWEADILSSLPNK